MYTKTAIFNDIIQIMKTDYAGYLEKQHVNHPENYRITDNMADQEFVKTIQSYLLDFKDGHLSFQGKQTYVPNIGFTVRRYKDALYVTSVTEETRLQVGDVIFWLDGLSINQVEKLHSKLLKDAVPERQYWGSVLKLIKQVVVRRQGNTFHLLLKTYERSSYVPSYVFQKLDNEIVYIKITDFSQAQPIQDLLDNNKNELTQSRHLIIDVRVNHGGNDLFYFPLLNYVFDQTVSFKSLFHEDEMVFTNYTERNCRLWIKELKEYLTQEMDAKTQQWIQEEKTLFESNYAKGMLPVPEEMDYIIHGQPMPHNVFVLTDITCGSSGDTFVQNLKKSPKVTVVGRPTMGIMDFFNVVTLDYGDYEFVYSISKMDEKYHYNDTGVHPHIYIPWTPQHIQEDVDLNYVLNLCQKIKDNPTQNKF